MTQLNISLSEAANQYVADQVASGRYSSASDFVKELVEKASREAAREHLAKLLEEGENSGPGTEYSEDEWARRLSELRAQIPLGRPS